MANSHGSGPLRTLSWRMTHGSEANKKANKGQGQLSPGLGTPTRRPPLRRGTSGRTASPGELLGVRLGLGGQAGRALTRLGVTVTGGGSAGATPGTGAKDGQMDAGTAGGPPWEPGVRDPLGRPKTGVRAKQLGTELPPGLWAPPGRCLRQLDRRLRGRLLIPKMAVILQAEMAAILPGLSGPSGRSLRRLVLPRRRHRCRTLSSLEMAVILQEEIEAILPGLSEPPGRLLRHPGLRRRRRLRRTSRMTSNGKATADQEV